MEIMKVQSVEHVQSDKRNRIIGGVYITFNSIDNVCKDDYFKLEFNGNTYNFQVTSIKVIGGILEVQACEAGYFVNKLSNKEGIDLRTIVGVEISPIKDKEEIKQIREESLWC